MMGIIESIDANCKNCYSCIRHCLVKAIQFQNDQATIVENECILCGQCYLVCPQNAKQIHSDLERIKGYIGSKQKVYVSLAPSYASAFPDANFSVMSAALKKLGFTAVEETAIGTAQVSEQYTQLTQEAQMKNIITTCCPIRICCLFSRL